MSDVMLEPLYDRVLVKREESEAVSKGGVIIPEIAQEKVYRGTVVAVGEGERFKDRILPMKVKPKDVVLFSKHQGTEVHLDGEEHVLLRESDLLAIQKGD